MADLIKVLLHTMVKARDCASFFEVFLKDLHGVKSSRFSLLR